MAEPPMTMDEFVKLRSFWVVWVIHSDGHRAPYGGWVTKRSAERNCAEMLIDGKTPHGQIISARVGRYPEANG